MNVRRYITLLLICCVIAPTLWSQSAYYEQDIRRSQTLAGHVQYRADPAGIEGVRVELCDADWKNVISTTTSDSDGNFTLSPPKSEPVYYLRFSKEAFSTLGVKVQLDSSAPKQLTVNIFEAH